MSLEEKKLQIIHDVMHVDKEAVLSAIQSFLADQRKAQYEEKLSTTMTVEELEMRLAQSEEDIRQGRVYASEEVKKRPFWRALAARAYHHFGSNAITVFSP